jgi:hypothetical protein
MGFVVLLVISGITITVLEFLAGNRGAAKFKFGATGVEVDSKFLGITVLVISLAFAYLFLEKAYQIEEIRGENAAEEPGAIPAEEQETETTADPRPEVSASNSGAGVLPGNGGL